MISKMIDIWRGATFLWFCAAVMAIFWSPTAVAYLDNKLFPVVTEFEVTSVVVSDKGISLSGRMFKPKWRGICQFKSSVATTNGSRQSLLHSSDNMNTFTRSSGWSTFQDWFIPGEDITHVTIQVRHKCHDFWDNVAIIYDSKIPPAVTSVTTH